MSKKLKKTTEYVVEDIASEINDAVEVFSDAAMKTAEVFSDAVSKVAEKQNSFLLKRHSSKQEHYLFAKRETKLGPGIYLAYAELHHLVADSFRFAGGHDETSVRDCKAEDCHQFLEVLIAYPVWEFEVQAVSWLDSGETDGMRPHSVSLLKVDGV